MTATTTAAGRLTALGRAEITLLVRNRSSLFVALALPALMVVAVRNSLGGLDLSGTGIDPDTALMTSGTGLALVLVVHMNLVSAYVARREDLVLKRLRTGEASDAEILAGSALPAAALALAQCAALGAAGAALLGTGAPERPWLLAAGVLLGVVLMAVLAAATSAVTRTVESAQITTLPMLVLSSVGSGLVLPLALLPDRLARLCELLPLTGAMTLVRAGWTGGAEPAELATAALGALAWTLLGVFAVRRWFRWEPRR
ncbi:ABC transporter permease [Streptomyces sanyensis]|uniref:ABC transporter permease n=1 Tax=Streptomyces sanyensis TaxID=568869 RepID=UPI003D76B3AD